MYLDKDPNEQIVNEEIKVKKRPASVDCCGKGQYVVWAIVCLVLLFVLVFFNVIVVSSLSIKATEGEEMSFTTLTPAQEMIQDWETRPFVSIQIGETCAAGYEPVFTSEWSASEGCIVPWQYESSNNVPYELYNLE